LVSRATLTGLSLCLPHCLSLSLCLRQTLDTWDNLYNFFMGRVRNNLHVCLCFSPVGEAFARRAGQFPGLING
jgi:hypothetical protein